MKSWSFLWQVLGNTYADSIPRIYLKKNPLISLKSIYFPFLSVDNFTQSFLSAAFGGFFYQVGMVEISFLTLFKKNVLTLLIKQLP